MRDFQLVVGTNYPPYRSTNVRSLLQSQLEFKSTLNVHVNNGCHTQKNVELQRETPNTNSVKRMICIDDNKDKSATLSFFCGS